MRDVRVAIYARVSTTRQETDNQLSVLREFCGRLGHTVAREYIEEVSAGGTKVRDQFRLMLEEARQRKFDMVLFWALDRFSREGALKTLQALEELTNAGVAWKSYTEQYLDSAGIFKDAIISIMATLAKQERLRIQERVKAGMERARKQGKHLGRPKRIVDRERVCHLYAQHRSIRTVAKLTGIGKDKVAALVKSVV